MTSPSLHIKQIIEDAAVTAMPLYIGNSPALPVENITIYDTGGTNANAEFQHDDVTFMIRVKAKLYADGYNTAYAIKRLLLGLTGWQTEGWNYAGFYLVSDVLRIGRDSDDYEIFTVNFLTLREPVAILPIFDIATAIGDVTVSEDGLTATIGTDGGSIYTRDIFTGSAVRQGIYFTIDADPTSRSPIVLADIHFTGGGKATGIRASNSYLNSAVSPYTNLAPSLTELVGIECCLAVDSVGTYGTLYLYLSSLPNLTWAEVTLDTNSGLVSNLTKLFFSTIGAGDKSYSITLLEAPTVEHSGVTNILG